MAEHEAFDANFRETIRISLSNFGALEFQALEDRDLDEFEMTYLL